MKRRSFIQFGALTIAAALVVGAGHGMVAAAQADGTSFDVGNFSQLQIEGAGHAIITIGQPASVTVTGPQDEIANLQVQVWFDTLEIEQENDDNHSSSSDLVYHITVPSLSQIELEDRVTAEIDGLTTDSLEISVEDTAGLQITNLTSKRLEAQIEGNATVSVTGSAERQELQIEDNGAYDALQLDSTSISIEAQGGSHSKLRFSDSLTGTVEDGAIIEYMTESGSVSVETEDGGRVNQLPFEALGA